MSTTAYAGDPTRQSTTEGGGGKTTLVAHLAVAAERAGAGPARRDRHGPAADPRHLVAGPRDGRSQAGARQRPRAAREARCLGANGVRLLLHRHAAGPELVEESASLRTLDARRAREGAFTVCFAPDATPLRGVAPQLSNGAPTIQRISRVSRLASSAATCRPPPTRWSRPRSGSNSSDLPRHRREPRTKPGCTVVRRGRGRRRGLGEVGGQGHVVELALAVG